MNRRVAAVLGLTAGALVTLWAATLVYVPSRFFVECVETGERAHEPLLDTRWRLGWTLEQPTSATPPQPGCPIHDEPTRSEHHLTWGQSIWWSAVTAEQLAILFLGGGTIMFMVRRERRRRAAA